MLKIKVSKEVLDEATALLGGDAKLARWFVDEMEKRAKSELAEALEEQDRVSQANFTAQHRPIEGVGQCMFRISRKLHNWIVKWVSADYVYDEAFLAQLIRDNSHLCLKPTYERKAQIIRPDWSGQQPAAGAA